MYEQITIHNFRGLRDLEIEDLGRLNLFVGSNNSGKTSLLEAAWLLQAPNNPTLVTNVATFRGFNPLLQAQDPGWRGLFYEMNPSHEIEIGGRRAGGGRDVLSITLSNDWAGELEAGSDGGAGLATVAAANTSAAAPETLYYNFRQDQRPPARSSVSVGLGRLGVHISPDVMVRPSIFLASRHRTSPEELADRFTKAQDTLGVQSIVKSLAVLQPGLTDLTIGYRLEGQQPQLQLRARIAGVGVPIPLQLLGEGVGRLSEILLALPSVPGGLLLVDEIENGLYYRNMEEAWRAIDATSRDGNSQLLATTHSAECVQAAVRAIAGDSAPDFRLYRLERDGETARAVKFDREAAATALEFELEFR